jgi:hypothetical protein
MKILCVALVLLTNTAFAGAAPEGVQKKDPRMFAILLAECAGVLDSERIPYLMEARKRGIFPDFDPAWCVKQGIVPEGWSKQGGKA